MNQIARIIGISALLSGATTSFAQNVSKAPIKVGVVMSFSGVYSQLGEEGLRGFTLYMDSIGNKVAGHPIQIVKEDEEADPAVALRKVQKLVTSDRVDILSGLVLAPSAYAVRDFVNTSKVPLVIFNGAGNALARERKSPYIYRVSGSSWQYSYPFGKYVADKVSKNVFIISTDYALGKESVADFKTGYTAQGGKVVGEVFVPLGTPDFSPYLARIMAAKPETVYAIMSGADAVLFLKQFNQFGLNKNIKLAVFGDMVDEKILAAVGDSTVGALSALPWTYDLPVSQNKVFIDAYRAKYKELPGVLSVRGWNAARVIVEALKKTGGNVADKDKLLAAIKNVNFQSPIGEFRFDPNTNNVVDPIYVRRVTKVSDGLINKMVVKLGNFADPGK